MAIPGEPAHLRDTLVGALHARLRRFMMSQDVTAVLDAAVTRQAAQLHRALPRPDRDPEAVRLLHGLYRARALACLIQDDEAAAEREQSVVDALARFMERAGWPDEPAGEEGPDAERLTVAMRRAETLTEEAARAVAAAVDDGGAAARACAACEEALDAVPEALPHLRAGPLQLWGVALRLLFERTGDPAHLHTCVSKLREALALAGPGHPYRTAVHSTLGVALRVRYEYAGELSDLEAAVRHCRSAAEAGDANAGTEAGAGAETTAGHHHNLGLALRLRYQRLGESDDMAHALRGHRTAVARSDAGTVGFAAFQLGLGNALGQALAEAGTFLPSPADVARARAERMAAFAAAAEHAGTPETAALAQAGRAGALASANATPAEYVTAARELRRTLAALPEGHPLLAKCRFQLGRVLMELSVRELDHRHLPEALVLHRAASSQGTADTWVRLAAAMFRGTAAMALESPHEAADAYALAVELLPRLARPQLALSDVEFGLASTTSLASDAAACAWRAGDPGRALRLLEMGRGVLLAQGVHNRGDLAELRSLDAALADRLTALRAFFDRGEPGAEGDLRHVRAREWEELLAEIRVLLPDFWRPPPLDALLEQGSRGPVVVVNVSHYGSAAFLLTPARTGGGLRVLPLPLLTPDAASSHSAALRSALTLLADPGTDLLAHPVQQTRIRDVLAWLWDAVVSPVLDALGPAERVWWVPTGPLAVLPLHAAQPPGRPGVLDAVISSYAPTVAVLAHARRPRRHAPPPSSALIAAVPAAPGYRYLHRADEEARYVARLFPEGRLLLGGAAHRDALEEGLRAHPATFHFSGHGVGDPLAPSAGRLLAADGPLTVADVAALDLPGAHLAYLSACATAHAGLHLPDEALHLTSAVQMAGYRHVVGTLWPVDDTESLMRVRAFYGHPLWSTDPALALHDTVVTARDTHPLAPSHWAGHVHSGG
ncbi:CHAT domain-containing protein [Streptomyces sp. NPDC059209]|uniref:CHAT domain-containing protein n=1 Tax=Streptomyces sp. NPDC059209 TaxID=3346769 RepID=UPI0036912525